MHTVDKKKTVSMGLLIHVCFTMKKDTHVQNDVQD